jgi:hypothetical protein
MKRGAFVALLLAILVFSSMALALVRVTTNEEGETVTTYDPPEEKQARDDFAKANPNVNVPLDASISGDASSGYTITPGSDPIKVGDQSYTRTFKMSGDGKVIQEASGLSDAGKTAMDVKDFVPQSNGDFSAGSVGAMEIKDFQGTSLQVEQGSDITKTSSSLCGSHADALRLGTTIHANVDDFCVRDKHVEVGHAEEVQIKCDDAGRLWTTSPIDDAAFTVDDTIHLTSTLEQELGITDCSGNDLEVSLINENSKADFAKDGLTMKISNATVTWPEEENPQKPDFIIQDVLQANGSATLHLDRLTKKVQWVEMEPYFNYEFRTDNPATDFGIRAEDVPAKVFIRRTANQVVPDDFLTCKNCGVIDLPHRMITIRGNIEYLRKWFDTKKTGLSNDYSVIYHATNPDAVTVMNLDESYTYVDDMAIMTDAPPITTTISNYLTAKEWNVGNETHRLLGVDEKLPKEQLAQNIIKSYRTVYSPATMSIDNNDLHYKRGTFLIDILSPVNPQIPDLMKGLLAVNASLLLAAFIFFPSRKGQLTVFILIGIVLLIFVAFMLYYPPQTKEVQLVDQQGVNTYIHDCLAENAKATLKFIGSQGGATTNPLTQWFDGVAKPLTKDSIEESLRADLSKRVDICVKKLPRLIKDVGNIEPSTISINASIKNKDVTFGLQYPAKIQMGTTTFTVSDQVIQEPNTLQQTITLATSTVMSEQQFNGFIDTDALRAEQAKMTFFPYTKTLVTLVQDTAYAEKGTPYQFAFSSNR